MVVHINFLFFRRVTRSHKNMFCSRSHCPQVVISSGFGMMFTPCRCPLTAASWHRHCEFIDATTHRMTVCNSSSFLNETLIKCCTQAPPSRASWTWSPVVGFLGFLVAFLSSKPSKSCKARNRLIFDNQTVCECEKKRPAQPRNARLLNHPMSPKCVNDARYRLALLQPPGVIVVG